jgi:hypothetical protein
MKLDSCLLCARKFNRCLCCGELFKKLALVMDKISASSSAKSVFLFALKIINKSNKKIWSNRIAQRI